MMLMLFCMDLETALYIRNNVNSTIQSISLPRNRENIISASATNSPASHTRLCTLISLQETNHQLQKRLVKLTRLLHNLKFR